MDDEEEDEEDKDAVASEPPFKASLFAFLEFSDSFRVNNLAVFFWFLRLYCLSLDRGRGSGLFEEVAVLATFGFVWLICSCRLGNSALRAF